MQQGTPSNSSLLGVVEDIVSRLDGDPMSPIGDEVYFLSTNDNWYLAGDGNAVKITTNDPLCYSTSAWNAGPQLSNYPNWFYLGGPGHTATNGCN